MFNKLILVGNLTRDPELKNTPQGLPVISFGIATNRKYSNSEETFFGNVMIYGKFAENIHKYLKKGTKCLIEGRLKTDYETKKTVIIAEQLKLLDSKKDQDNEVSRTNEEPF